MEEDNTIEVAGNSIEELCEEIKFFVKVKRRLEAHPFIKGKLWWDGKQNTWKGKLTFTGKKSQNQNDLI